jgi:uncharacterized protein YcbK (DUF882 family)
MKLSENFDSREFQCKCCGELPENGMNPHLIELLQAIREKLGKSITITSGYRCQKHNAKVDGAKHSQHVLGNAADIQVAGMSANDVHDYLASHFGVRCKGLGQYQNFTHIDVRTGSSARWIGSK